MPVTPHTALSAGAGEHEAVVGQLAGAQRGEGSDEAIQVAGWGR